MNGTYYSRILPPVLKQLQGGSVLLSCGLGQEVLLSLEFHSVQTFNKFLLLTNQIKYKQFSILTSKTFWSLAFKAALS